jgi:mono/diheme cytochrome c family protein
MRMTSPLRRALSACFLLLVFSALMAVLTDLAVASSSSGDARERGATVFHTRGCERCHSILGVGGDRAPDLATVGKRRSASQIKTQVMNGGHGMPPFGDVLSKDEVKDVVAFLSSCRTKDAPGCRQWMPAETAQ